MIIDRMGIAKADQVIMFDTSYKPLLVMCYLCQPMNVFMFAMVNAFIKCCLFGYYPSNRSIDNRTQLAQNNDMKI